MLLVVVLVESFEVEASEMEEGSNRASGVDIPFGSVGAVGTPCWTELEVALLCTGAEEPGCWIWLAQFSCPSPAFSCPSPASVPL